MMSSDWPSIFLAISMDRTQGLPPDGGFKLKPSPTLQTICRDFMREFNQFKRKQTLLLAETLERIKQEEGEQTVIALREWEKKTYIHYHEASNQASGWVIPLGRLSGFFLVDRVPLVPLNLPEIKVLKIQNLALLCLGHSHKLNGTLSLLAQRPFSEWDAYVYETYKGGSPLDWISGQINFMYKVALWQGLEALLTPEEQAILEQWAVQQVEALQTEGYERATESFVHFRLE